MSTRSILDSALDLAEQHVAIVRLRERAKRPVLGEWTRLPRYTVRELERAYRRGENIGIRLGEPSEPRDGWFVMGIDVDVRDPDDPKGAFAEAMKALREVFPEIDKAPSVISGSGGYSRHYYVLCNEPFRKINLAKSERKVKVGMEDGEPVYKRAWEVDLYGTGAQMVLPPSIHPSGNPYRWESGEAPDFASLPRVYAEDIEYLYERQRKGRDRNLFDPEPLDVLEDILFETKTYDNRDGMDYDDWRDVIFAIKTEYHGTDLEDEAFQLLEEWSSSSGKHNQARFEEVWDHADAQRVGGITLGSLKKKSAKEIHELRGERIVAEMRDERTEEEKANPEKARAEREARNWYGKIALDGNGVPINCAENVELVIANDPVIKEHLFYAVEEARPTWRMHDELPPELQSLQFEKRKKTLFYDRGCHYIVLQKLLRASYAINKVAKETINDSIRLVAQHRPFYRLRETINRVQWDGKPRIATLFCDYLGARESAYTRGCGWMFCVAIAGRIFQPGLKCDHMIILEGKQGIGKDQFLSRLVGFDESNDLYTASRIDVSDPAQFLHVVRGKAIVHLSELSAMSRAETNHMKDFVTQTEDTARLPYEPEATTLKRTWVLVGSTNDETYLKDVTGDRRYLPIECGLPDFGPDGVPRAYKKMFSDLDRERDQIWAEAIHEFLKLQKAAGGHLRELRLPKDALPEAREMQERKRLETAEEEMAHRAAALLNDPVELDELLPRSKRTDKTRGKMAMRNSFTSRDLYVDVLGGRDSNFHRALMSVQKAITLIPGWKKSDKKIKVHGTASRVWVRDGTDGAPTILDSEGKARSADVFEMKDERSKRRPI